MKLESSLPLWYGHGLKTAYARRKERKQLKVPLNEYAAMLVL
jgi:hypothetical protein